ncbi:hypothetical protein EDD29_4507 [Actinocorallia herbida]|uniref:Phospholipase D-like protein n=1 Tax=Actinocorallia herbida TaxID=58109 RepID=A0A3N1D072_9ACTN|nr:hypothetical protein [Actinocorallia herbida]ROO86923.1 hypothetical protein EDD29_4507 [Actinocorallia herbida]
MPNAAGPDPAVVMAGALVTLAFFMLVAFIAREYKHHPGKAVAVLTAVATVLIAFPAILYALYG